MVRGRTLTLIQQFCDAGIQCCWLGDALAGSSGLCFMDLAPRRALVDTAAGQALLGEDALENIGIELEKLGLRPVRRELSASELRSLSASGIGGKATVTGVVLLPTAVAGNIGVVAYTVLGGRDRRTPPLLSCALSSALKVKVDLDKMSLEFPRGAVPMTQHPGGT